jgi:hypothetical protein
MTPNPFTEPDISKRWMELHKAVIEHDVSGVNSAISSPNTSQQVKRTSPASIAQYLHRTPANKSKGQRLYLLHKTLTYKIPSNISHKNMWNRAVFLGKITNI